MLLHKNLSGPQLSGNVVAVKKKSTLAQDFETTFEPLLSGHPRGNGKWPINRGWPLNRGRRNWSDTSIKRSCIQMQACLKAFNICWT